MQDKVSVNLFICILKLQCIPYNGRRTVCTYIYKHINNI